MRIYRSLWWSLTVPVGLAGVAAAIASSSVLTVVIMFGLIALCLGTLSANLQSLDGEGQASAPISVSAVVRHGCAAGVTVVSLFGLGTLIGVAVVPLTVILGVTCPFLVARWRARERPPQPEPPAEDEYDRPEPPAPVAGSVETEPTMVEAMTDPELCMAWRRSFVELQRSDCAQTCAAIAEFRRQVLDELERRNPAGFGDWLASGARAPSDPARYLLDRPGAKRPHQ